MVKKGKAAGPTGIVSQMFTADEDCNVEWLISLSNLIFVCDNNGKCFPLHQSLLSFLQRAGLPLELLYADDLTDGRE